jgi:hypothetical protein
MPARDMPGQCARDPSPPINSQAPTLLEMEPLLPEAIDLAVETGLRKEGLFR